MTTRVLIMAGGTGGHVFPALAVAEELKSRAVDVFWMGTQQGIEAKLVPAAGYPLSFISVQGLRGKGILGWLLAPFKLLKSVFEALTTLNKIKPDVVLGLGGFASGPGGLAAWMLRKPLLIHEQNAIPGLTNRVLAKFAKKVMEGFPQSFSASTAALWVGNPVRTSIETIAAPELRFADRTGPIRILVLGGSLGARKLNTVLPPAIALIDGEQRPEIIHQCGPKHSEDCINAYEQAQISAQVKPFIEDMAVAYAWADLVICRAGALTIAELSSAGVGALLVPYPYAVDDHQTHNAASLVSVGAGLLVPEQILTAELLADEIKRLSHDREQLLTMAKTARLQSKLGTAKLIADVCLELTHG
ncbi:MAG: undecaprenyldiphospho-muramoylpentapeptide beta-N-acetylglucosaminyltransferase [Methylophaga sp.]|nr:MAG: undecaprenyldiphospho-muramoylpentapeptide beta-N-acetylglucosaminyltransferase [Methylophaga sp.]